MRIVGGSWRGRALAAPEGRAVTRPTTDRMRESLASMVLAAFSLDLSGVSVLDAFAGSGALGLEMLSRGARQATFVERDRAALECLRRNVRGLGAEGRCRIVRGDALKLASRPGLAGTPFDLVLLDPPYALGADAVAGLLESLRAQGMLAADTVVLYERARDAGSLELAWARPISSKRHAATALDLFRVSGDGSAHEGAAGSAMQAAGAEVVRERSGEGEEGPDASAGSAAAQGAEESGGPGAQA